MAKAEAMGKRRFWTVLKTKQAASGDAVRNVTSQGFEVCHLMFRERPHRGVRKIMPLFPYYLLVHVDLKKNWRALHSTRGVTQMFMSGDLPSRVPDEDVNRFRDALNDLGYYEDQDHGAAPRFCQGDHVQPTRGLMAAQDGVYQGIVGSSYERVRVLFRILGVPKVLEMSAHDLVAA